MRDILAGVLGVLIGLGAPAACAQPPPLRLEDAVGLALTRNERARIADLQVVVAHAGVERARAGFLPVLVVSGNDSERAGAPGPANAATGAVSLTQPLVNLPAWPLYGQARQTLDAQRALSSDDKRGLAFDAARAFLGVLTAQAVLGAASQRFATAQANLADTQARAQAQLTSTSEVTRAQIDLASAAREVALDRGTLDDSAVALGFVSAAPVTTSLAAPAATLDAAERPLGDLDSLVRFARAHRPDLVAAEHTARAAHDFAVEPLYRLAPMIGLTGQVQATNNSSTSGPWHDESASLTLNWTVYDAGIRYADRHGRVASASIADLAVAALARNIDSQVHGAAALLASAQAALDQAEAAVKASRQSATETAILYKQGLAKAIELIDANDQRFEAEVSDSEAEYAMAAAYLNLRQALGLGPLGTELR